MQVGFILIVLIQMSININGQTSRPPHIIFILASDLWHLGFSLRKYTPTRRGFDSHFGSWTGSLDYYQYNSVDYLNLPSRSNLSKYVSGKDLWNNFTPERRISGQYATDLFTDAAIDVINSHNANTPLLLYLSHVGVSRGNPYSSYRISAYAERFAFIRDPVRKAFAGSLYALDQSVGRVMEALSNKNMLINSIVVFTSDTGAPITGPNRNGGSNYPMRSQRNTNWEGSIRVPAIIWKADIPERVYEGLMHATDWFPTLYTAAGGNPGDLGKIDGLNQWPAISSDSASPREKFLINFDQIYNPFAYRSGDVKMIYGNYSYVGNTNIPWDQNTGRIPNPGPKPPGPSLVLQILRVLFNNNTYNPPSLNVPSITCGNVRRTANPNECNQVPCLFDIAADPCETDNILDREPELSLSFASFDSKNSYDYLTYLI